MPGIKGAFPVLFIFAIFSELEGTRGIRLSNRFWAWTYGFASRLIDKFHQIWTSHGSLRLILRCSSQTIFAPKTVVLTAFFNLQGIKTRLITLRQLDGPDQLCFSHIHCLNAFSTRKCPYSLPFHNLTSYNILMYFQN